MRQRARPPPSGRRPSSSSTMAKKGRESIPQQRGSKKQTGRQRWPSAKKKVWVRLCGVFLTALVTLHIHEKAPVLGTLVFCMGATAEGTGRVDRAVKPHATGSRKRRAVSPPRLPLQLRSYNGFPRSLPSSGQGVAILNPYKPHPAGYKLLQATRMSGDDRDPGAEETFYIPCGQEVGEEIEARCFNALSTLQEPPTEDGWFLILQVPQSEEERAINTLTTNLSLPLPDAVAINCMKRRVLDFNGEAKCGGEVTVMATSYNILYYTRAARLLLTVSSGGNVQLRCFSEELQDGMVSFPANTVITDSKKEKVEVTWTGKSALRIGSFGSYIVPADYLERKRKYEDEKKRKHEAKHTSGDEHKEAEFLRQVKAVQFEAGHFLDLSPQKETLNIRCRNETHGQSMANGVRLALGTFNTRYPFRDAPEVLKSRSFIVRLTPPEPHQNRSELGKTASRDAPGGKKVVTQECSMQSEKDCVTRFKEFGKVSDAHDRVFLVGPNTLVMWKFIIYFVKQQMLDESGSPNIPFEILLTWEKPDRKSLDYRDELDNVQNTSTSLAFRKEMTSFSAGFVKIGKGPICFEELTMKFNLGDYVFGECAEGEAIIVWKFSQLEVTQYSAGKPTTYILAIPEAKSFVLKKRETTKSKQPKVSLACGETSWEENGDRIKVEILHVAAHFNHSLLQPLPQRFPPLFRSCKE